MPPAHRSSPRDPRYPELTHHPCWTEHVIHAGLKRRIAMTYDASHSSKLVSRRRFLTLVGIGAGASLLVACGQSSTPLPTSAAAPSKPAEAAKPPEAKPPGAPPAAQPAATQAAPAAAAKPADAKPAGQAAPAANLAGQTVKFGVLANYKGE